MSKFTSQQRKAITRNGNLLVVAGAGTGKTHTLVARCLRLVTEDGASLENILMVTFTEAAATEMRARIREELRRLQGANPEDKQLAQEMALLDTAHICTLHSFCAQLARAHFHELGLDPQFSVLDEQQTRPLMREALDELLEAGYSGQDAGARAIQALVRSIDRVSDGRVRGLVLKLHVHSQSLPDPGGWLEAQQSRFERTEPDEWRQWFLEAVTAWRGEFVEAVGARAGQAPAVTLCQEALREFPANPGPADAAAMLRAIREADAGGNWPLGTKGTVRKALREFFGGAEFLESLLPDEESNDPLAQDWDWVRPRMTALVSLTREFTARFTAAKRELGGVDFADLEQCALRLLRNPVIADEWRARLAQVFVDEYQDINAAQDAILTALSRSGAAANRFMVGDVKQSIYRFRLANPKIFGRYDESWSKPGGDGCRIPLTENFRSREALLDFVNPLFAALMRPEVGGVTYEKLRFGKPGERTGLAAKAGAAPRVEFHLIARPDEETSAEESESGSEEALVVTDLLAVEREARLVARRLRELKESGHEIWDEAQNCFRPVKWSDMAVLLRSPTGRAEAFAIQFSKAGVPLMASRDGFFASLEVSDLLNLLRLLDNPLQDVPLAAVLRSPLVGLSLDELAQVRAHNSARPFWTALARWQGAPGPESRVALHAKVTQFLDQYHRWRGLVRRTSLSQCLETALTETHYEALLLAGPRGPERAANVRRLLELARQFDPYQRQGLYRFLRFVEAQEEEELDLQPAPVPAGEAVQLRSIHKSKGLEFPVVVLACLGTRFNEQDLHKPVLLSEVYGLCPRITPPGSDQNYPSLPYWLARRGERRELRGEELRLLYVAMTRARDALVLVGTTHRQAGDAKWASTPPGPVSTNEVVDARSHLDWLLKWLPCATTNGEPREERSGENRILRWRIYDEADAVFVNEALPPSAPLPEWRSTATSDAEVVEQLKSRVTWNYPFMAATVEAAKTSVSALRRRAADETDEEARRIFDARISLSATATRPPESTGLSATERGRSHHVFLQLLELGRAGSEAELRAEARRFSESGRMKPEQVSALNFAALAAFWQSDLGRRIRAESGCARRELGFTARFTPGELAAVTRAQAATGWGEDFVVVQGVADLAVLRPDEIWLVDFKTDEVNAEEVAAKARLYEPQLKLYALALKRIYGRPVTECWLHFLALPRTVRVDSSPQRCEQAELF